MDKFRGGKEPKPISAHLNINMRRFHREILHYNIYFTGIITGSYHSFAFKHINTLKNNQ